MSWLVLPLAALGAGVLSFTSPCCLPLIPGYLSYVSALPVSELGGREARAVTLRASLCFVAGFALVFTALGVSFAFVGAALLRHVPFLVEVAGVGIIVMGLAMMGIVRAPVLLLERRPLMSGVSPGPRGAFGLGVGFQQALRSTEWLRRNGRRLEILGGLLLVAVGVLFVSGGWQTIFLP